MSEGARVVRVGMGWERWERNSEGMGGVRVFSGGVNDGRGGRRWELWGLEKERVVGFGGDESGGVVRADRELGKERVVVGAVRAEGAVGGDENKRGCPKSFS